MVPETGIEPVRSEEQGGLSPSRLPIPPPGQENKKKQSTISRNEAMGSVSRNEATRQTFRNELSDCSSLYKLLFLRI